MKKSLLWLLIVLLSVSMVVTFSLAGCKKEEVEEAAPVEEEAEEVTEEEAVIEEEGKNFEGQELVAIYMSGNYADAARLIEKEFEEMTGASVTVVDAPYASLYEKEFTDLITDGGAYDVIDVASQWDGQFAEYLEPIDEKLENDTKLNIEDFIGGISRVTGIWQGVRFGIPNACDGYGIIYRTDIFEAEGITEEDCSTWDGYFEVAKNLTKDGMFGTAIAGVKHQLDAYWTARYWSMGGHLMSKDWKTPLPQRDTAVNALEMIIDLMEYMPEGVMAYDIPDENAMFLKGNIAMAELWPSLIRGTANDPEQSNVIGKWSVMPYPGANPQMSSWDLAIPKTSEVKELAFEWIKFYTSEENQRLFLKEIGIGPTRSAIYEDPEVIKENPDFPNMLISLEGVRSRFRIAQSQETFDFLDEKISDALTGTLTPEQAIDEVVNQWTEKISNNPPEGVEEYTDDYVE